MEQLAHFQPVFLTILGIVFVVGIVFSVQQYIKSQVDPLETKIDHIENDLIELKTENRMENTRMEEHWADIKLGLESVRLKLHELALGQIEMKTAIFGADSNSGIRGEIQSLRQDVKELSSRVGSLEREDRK
jgi:hypothetical protein